MRPATCIGPMSDDTSTASPGVSPADFSTAMRCAESVAERNAAAANAHASA